MPIEIETDPRQIAGLAGKSESPAVDDVSSEFLRFPVKARVLMVDDDKLNSFVVAEYLKSDGYRDLTYTTDPFSALRLAFQQRPDVILLDLQMPKLGGLEILRDLRDDEAFDRIAVVILTASTDEKLKARAMELGATDVLDKSLGRKEFLARLRKVVAAQAQNDQVRMV